MNTTSRRHFLKLLGASSALVALPSITSSNPSNNTSGANARVIVVGGGFAGATVAKYLKHWSNTLDVILIEPNDTYYSPILSTLVLTEHLDVSRISFTYDELSKKYGVQWVQDYVEGVDTANQTISLRGGQSLSYDRLVLAPGIDFVDIPGLDSNKVPHAWKAGAQTLLLQQQLQAMPNNGTFVMTIPASPYRCPPGPYERACAVAEFLQDKKGGGKVIVLDANADITAGKRTFSNAFNTLYKNTIEYHPNVQLHAVDSDFKVAQTSAGNFQADVLNVIPAQKAGNIIHTANLANDSTGRWAEVNPLSYESTAASCVHIIGDSQGTGQPKAGHIANAEAKVCADAIIRSLAGQAPYASPMTNSACYSPVTSNTASWLTAVFAYDAASNSMKVVPNSGGESPEANNEHFEDMFEWTTNLFSDTFA